MFSSRSRHCFEFFLRSTGERAELTLWLAGASWTGAFGLFAIFYGRILMRPRVRGKLRRRSEVGTILMIDWGSLARAIHILAFVVWIGGVSLVTTALLPAMKQKPSEQWMRDFDEVERRFAPQARVAVLLVLLTGLYMLYAYDLWDRFVDARFWWMHLMAGVGLLFAALLFVVEPLTIRHAVRERRDPAPQVAFPRILWVRRALLTLSLITIFAAVGGSHGLF